MDSHNPHANIHSAVPIGSARNTLPMILPPPHPKEFFRYTDPVGLTYIYAFSLNDAQNVLSKSDPNYKAKSPIAVF